MKISYGLPYKGSKRRLALKILQHMPRRDNFVDLFCGGCAVSHAAMLGNRFRHIYINDINPMCPQMFVDALQGRYNDDRRWISHEEFDRLKSSDPYVAFVWSFGNNLRNYLYNREVESLKRAMHHAIFFHDYEPARAFGLDLSFCARIADEYRRYLAVKHYVNRNMDASQLPSASRPGNMSSSERASLIRNIGGVYSTCSTTHPSEYYYRLQYRESHSVILQLHRSVQQALRGGANSCKQHRLSRLPHTAA